MASKANIPIPKAKGQEILPKQKDVLLNELKNNPVDPHTFSRPDHHKVHHIDLHLLIDFSVKRLSGSVVLTIKKISDQLEHLFLDTFDLKIHRVSVVEDKAKVPLTFTLSQSIESFGSKLSIDLSKVMHNEFQIEIQFETGRNPIGTQWFTKANSDHQLMATHFWPIRARTVLPCQDTPSVKITYTATIEAPTFATVLMSATSTGKPTKSSTHPDTHLVHQFTQQVAIPSYLIAIVSGALVSKQLGPHSHVWSEEGYLQRAEKQLKNIDSVLVAVEELVNMKNPFGLCDVVVLPPGYHHSGMEHPCIIYINYDQLTGHSNDVQLIAHELAHQFVGNLVSIKNFQHLWLCEGFATMLERKVLGKLRKDDKRRLFAAADGYRGLKSAIKTMGLANPLTKLVTDLRGLCPSRAFNMVPYEKGHSLLCYLEELIGGHEVFEPFLRAFIHHFQNRSIDSHDFKHYFVVYFTTKGAKQQIEKLNQIDWDAWFNSTGNLPVDIEHLFENSHMKRCLDLARDWLSVKDEKLIQPFHVATFNSLYSCERRTFLVELADKAKSHEHKDRLSDHKMRCLTDFYELKKANTEVRCAWILLGLNCHWKEIVPEAVRMLKHAGPLCYLQPVYRAMKFWTETAQLALDTFHEEKGRMGPYSRVEIELELKDEH